MVEHYFEVEYRYYQFNSGQADNGFYNKIIQFKDEQEAISLASRIEADALLNRKDIHDDVDQELRDEFIPWSGYFTGAKVYRCQREEIS